MRPITGITILGIRLGVIVVGLYWLTLFVGTHLPAGRAVGPQINDKVLHFSGFFLLSLLCCYATQSSPNDRRGTVRRFAKIAGGLALYAAIDELTQAFSVGRTTDVRDFLADVAGTVTAIAVYLLLRTALRRRATHRQDQGTQWEPSESTTRRSA
ncbi:VanZ family protein [Roseiconus nitratireducens]|uniref:VanZ family protein n=1 Tax=Roseiconus nitratireducens TaxID=2605748 RepID=A0A5M6DIV0_9BACT|nr:VanZ family protein [Roseiconus nitratireducens]KAA5546180.1 VanZ family protein [Roseiconus nitratireducens]